MSKLDFSARCVWNDTSRAPLFSAVVAGDFCPKDPASQELLKQGKAKDILAPILPAITRNTFKLLQFETVLTVADTPIDKSGPNLKAPHAAAEFAVPFDAALLANNHTGDFGEAALLETMDVLHQHNLATAGAGKDPEDAAKVLYLTKNGFTLAVVNACEHEFGWAWGDHAGSNAIDMADLRQKIETAKQNADAVIAILHGGNETNPFPSPGMTRRLRALADDGADAVVNIHPHCPQGVEIYRGVPIIYSPGNFYFPYPTPHAGMWYDGFLPEIGFDKTGAVSLAITPYRFDTEAVRPLTGEAEKHFLEYMKLLSAPITNKAELAAWFEAWAAQRGPYWAVRQNTPETLHPAELAREVRKPLLPLCNLWSCEAHNELLTTFMQQIEHAVPPDTERIAQIEKLQETRF